ncbi:histidinol-phosphate transaminase [Micromonospora sp. PLK6-60]|uniref:histidinol-phosphate transaminase n=1 Tax=Micromonospora sp. PLK6-60 TaxID=2873383 RepID=UPI001CA68086|nr:histidinol-phosphate transaminase [Micromonospora sp. PLK6-60]MBY8875056.1 histidinol-phosphate transaminase [Micromonospora sp. PLK6-60]
MTVPSRADLATLPDYIIPRQAPGAILLNSNELPMAPLPAVAEALAAAARDSHRYPQWFSEDLVAALAARIGVPESWLAVGCGSVSLCAQLIQAYCRPGDEVLCAWRSFEAYPVLARIAGATPRTVPLDAAHRHDLVAMAAAVTPATRLTFLCNPNNPTGTAFGRQELHAFLDRVPPDVLVVLDEAYHEFAGPDVADGVSVLADRENVAVLRTFSKAYGLAGVRVGYCVAPPAVIREVHRVAVPFVVSRLAQRSASVALRHADEVAARCATVVRERERVFRALRGRGFPVPRSQANFLWLPLGAESGRFAEYCAEQGILVRRFGDEGVRVTVGLPDENDAFLRAAEQFPLGAVGPVRT